MGIWRRGNKNVRENRLFEGCEAVGPLLPTLFESSVVGVAVLDSRMRFCAINDTLAAMNGVPTARHLGRTLRYVLGGTAPAVEQAMTRCSHRQTDFQSGVDGKTSSASGIRKLGRELYSGHGCRTTSDPSGGRSVGNYRK